MCYDPDTYYGTPWYADDHRLELEEYFDKPFEEITDEEISEYAYLYVH